MRSLSPATRHFARHYAEMVAAMLLGMVVFAMPAEGLLRAAGSSSSELWNDAPALALLGMAVMMTVPMVGWMRYRGHRWQPCAEMAASMFLPTFAAIGLLAGGLLTDTGALMGIEHTAMLPAMLVAMLLRVGEYNGAHHDHLAQQVAA